MSTWLWRMCEAGGGGGFHTICEAALLGNFLLLDSAGGGVALEGAGSDSPTESRGWQKCPSGTGRLCQQVMATDQARRAGFPPALCEVWPRFVVHLSPHVSLPSCLSSACLWNSRPSPLASITFLSTVSSKPLFLLNCSSLTLPASSLTLPAVGWLSTVWVLPLWAESVSPMVLNSLKQSYKIQVIVGQRSLASRFPQPCPYTYVSILAQPQDICLRENLALLCECSPPPLKKQTDFTLALFFFTPILTTHCKCFTSIRVFVSDCKDREDNFF